MTLTTLTIGQLLAFVLILWAAVYGVVVAIERAKQKQFAKRRWPSQRRPTVG
jgi:hypothetical protein